jgi:hypothetical protein
MRDRQSVAHDLLGHRQLGGLNPETPGFAPPPHDELAFYDTLGIGSYRPAFKGLPRDWS